MPGSFYEIGLTKMCGAGDTAKVVLTRITTLAHGKCAEVSGISHTAGKYSARIEWQGEASAYNVRP